MKVQKIFNTTKKEIESKKFNIFIGISLGNKWFTKKNLRGYLNWALEHTKNKVLFLIADKIHAINYCVRNKKHSQESNLKKALKEGRKVKKIILKLIAELPKERQNKIKILRWEEYKKYDKFSKKYTSILYNGFEKNAKFQKEILKIIKDSIKDKNFSDEEYLKLSEYFLEEFTAIYSGIKDELNYYGMYIYPQDTLISSFVENIQQAQIFKKLNKKLPKEKVALAIIN